MRLVLDPTPRARIELPGLARHFQSAYWQGSAFADLLLVDSNPLENITLVAEPDKNFLVIIKDGRICKNRL